MRCNQVSSYICYMCERRPVGRVRHSFSSFDGAALAAHARANNPITPCERNLLPVMTWSSAIKGKLGGLDVRDNLAHHSRDVGVLTPIKAINCAVHAVLDRDTHLHGPLGPVPAEKNTTSRAPRRDNGLTRLHAPTRICSLPPALKNGDLTLPICQGQNCWAFTPSQEGIRRNVSTSMTCLEICKGSQECIIFCRSRRPLAEANQDEERHLDRPRKRYELTCCGNDARSCLSSNFARSKPVTIDRQSIAINKQRKLPTSPSGTPTASSTKVWSLRSRKSIWWTTSPASVLKMHRLWLYCPTWTRWLSKCCVRSARHFG